MKKLYYIFSPAIDILIVAGILDYFYEYAWLDMLSISLLITVALFIGWIDHNESLPTFCSGAKFFGIMIALRECEDLFGPYHELADIVLSLFAFIILILIAIAAYKQENLKNKERS